MMKWQPFWDWVVFAKDFDGKAYGGIDGIRDDAPEEMKKQFWDWVAFMKECDANGISP